MFDRVLYDEALELKEVRTDDIYAAHALHTKMDCICYLRWETGTCFINDPDGHWLEIVYHTSV
jgi:hypothetical protein